MYERLIANAESGLAERYAEADAVSEVNQLKVLNAMRANRLSETHFGGTNGYGYNDAGRGVLERVYADVFRAEAALVRPQLVSGTHALAAALFGNLRHGDELLSPAGKPYDTLESVIGIREAAGSLAEHGVAYRQAELGLNGGFDFGAVADALSPKTKMVTIQRSKGYAWRRSFTVSEINDLILFIREKKRGVIIMVDNCYGEFVEREEPAGADLIVGSLIKNPGGGLAPGGGYVAGRAEFVEAAAARLFAPGLCGEIGPSFGFTRLFAQGLFTAPQTVANCVKGALLASAVFEELGFPVLPKPYEARTDIVQAVELGTPEGVCAFCGGIQACSPVDSFVKPEPAPMPGYDAKVVMAGGTFVQGSSIELSADAPLRPPYAVYMQGGLTYAHAKLGLAAALEGLFKAGLIDAR